MNNPAQPILSTRQLLISFTLAMTVGIAITFFVILPAELGQDPIGVGAMIGLDRLAEIKTDAPVQSTVVITETGGENFYVAIDPKKTTPAVDEYGQSLPALDGANLRVHDVMYNSETVEILLDTDAQVKYKVVMDKGEVLLYRWEANGDVYYDFHAHQVEGNPDFWTRYSEDEGKADQGSIVTPYQGQHGWFWLNIASKPITVKLKVTGYFDELVEIDLAAENPAD